MTDETTSLPPLSDDIATAAFDPVASAGWGDTDTIEPIADSVVEGELTPPTVVRTSAREIPVVTPTPARMPPSAKPLRPTRPATARIPAAPVALPPSVPPHRLVASEPPGWDTITSGAPVAAEAPGWDTITNGAPVVPIEPVPPDILPWENAALSQPVPVVAEPYEKPRRSLLWLWYLLILAATIAAGWYGWMYFARDELNPQPVNQIVETIGFGVAVDNSWDVI